MELRPILRSTNFGSCLQAFALYKKIEMMGYQCEIIDYRCPAIEARENLTVPQISLFKPKSVYHRLFLWPTLKRKANNLEIYLANHAKISEEYTPDTITFANENYGKFLVGSDIVWGRDITNNDYVYFLDFVSNDHKKYAFSASAGDYSIRGDEEKVGELLKSFSRIAVREKETIQSGGIATELYRFFSDKGYKLAGVSMTPMHTAEFSLSDSFESMPAYRNSKYVYSDAGNIYYEVGKNLVNQRGVLFIGLPCQVAALKKYLFVKKISLELLFTVDIVCHGTTPEQFLGEHIEHIEKKKKKKAIHVEFRDPEEKTSSFTFSLKDAEHTFYKRRVKANDVYQIGYHAGITYRDNCYSCQFATRKRQGDITLADFSYVGSYEFCSYSNENVSCVLINSKKGESLFSELCSTDRIFYEKRPIEEEVTTEKQLNYPTRVPREREKFLKEIKSNNGFEKAMKYAARKIMIVNTVKNITHIEKIKQIMSEKLPPNVKNGIKKVLKR